MTRFTPEKPNRPASSKRMTDRQVLTRLRGVRKAMDLAGRVEFNEDDKADVTALVWRWFQDWEPR